MATMEELININDKLNELRMALYKIDNGSWEFREEVLTALIPVRKLIGKAIVMQGVIVKKGGEVTVDLR